MSWNEEDIQRVRDIPLSTELGLRNGRRMKINCPFPEHRDDNASFLVYENNGFHCFGCGAHGNNFIDFCTILLAQNGLEGKEAFKDIMETYGNKI